MNDLMNYIDVAPIVEIAKKENCPYIGIIGGKGTGKTWGCVDWSLKESNNFTIPFFYARRYDKTFTPSIIGNLIQSHKQDIINLSGGKLNNSTFKGRAFTVSREVVTESGTKKQLNARTICYCRSLNNVETETGDDKGLITSVIYDEFLSRSGELKSEFQKLMILHNNAVRNRTDRFVPLFMLGNTLTKDSQLAEEFGFRLRDIREGLNVIRNKKGQARLILYYTPPTKKQAEAAETYYDRFENDKINMISHGDWMIGDYPLADEKLLHQTGTNFLFFDRGLAVRVTIFAYGYNAFVVIRKPRKTDEKPRFRISPIISENNLNRIPAAILNAVVEGRFAVESSEIGEDFRDICKHLVNGAGILRAIE